MNHGDGWKLSIAWLGAVIGTMTLQEWVLLATLVYTVLQIGLVVRRYWRDK